MSSLVLTNAEIYLGGYRISGVSNSISLEYSSEVLDDSIFGTVFRQRIGGAKSVAFGAEGRFSPLFDGDLLDAMLLQDLPVTVMPETAVSGGTCFSTLLQLGEYTPLGGAYGEFAKFSISGEGGQGVPLLPGIVGKAGTESVSGVGAGVQLGAVGSGQSLYSCVHLVVAGGTSPSLTVQIESDSDNTFASPIVRGTATNTSVTAELLQIDGPISDTWYRVRWTLTGTTAVVNFLVTLSVV